MIRRGTACTAEFTNVPVNSPHVFGLRLLQSGLKPQTAIQPKYTSQINSHLLLEHHSLVFPSLGLQLRFKTASVSKIASYIVPFRAQRCDQTLVWLNRPKDIDLRFVQVSALSSLAYLGSDRHYSWFLDP
jgi:hypothetical protein